MGNAATSAAAAGSSKSAKPSNTINLRKLVVTGPTAVATGGVAGAVHPTQVAKAQQSASKTAATTAANKQVLTAAQKAANKASAIVAAANNQATIIAAKGTAQSTIINAQTSKKSAIQQANESQTLQTETNVASLRLAQRTLIANVQQGLLATPISAVGAQGLVGGANNASTGIGVSTAGLSASGQILEPTPTSPTLTTPGDVTSSGTATNTTPQVTIDLTPDATTPLTPSEANGGTGDLGIVPAGVPANYDPTGDDSSSADPGSDASGSSGDDGSIATVAPAQPVDDSTTVGSLAGFWASLSQTGKVLFVAGAGLAIYYIYRSPKHGK